MSEHVATIEPLTTADPASKLTGWRGTCSCGWNGTKRPPNAKGKVAAASEAAYHAAKAVRDAA